MGQSKFNFYKTNNNTNCKELSSSLIHIVAMFMLNLDAMFNKIHSCHIPTVAPDPSAPATPSLTSSPTASTTSSARAGGGAADAGDNRNEVMVSSPDTSVNYDMD